MLSKRSPVRRVASSGTVTFRLGHRLLDEYLRFVAARARPNTVLATAYDLKVFFAWANKQPAAVTTTDVIAFVAAQRSPRSATVVRLSDGGSGLSARTVARRLSSCRGCSPTSSPEATPAW